MNPLDFYQQKIDDLNGKNLLRSLNHSQSQSGLFFKQQNTSFLNFASNQYLNLNEHPQLIEAGQKALSQWGAGSGGSRLLGGSLQIHEEFEDYWAKRTQSEASLLFNQGYTANIGMLASLGLARKEVTFFVDQLAHASMIEGILQSGAKWQRFRHNDMVHLESLLIAHREKNHGPAWIVSESLFSMDGDFAPLSEIVTLAKKYNAFTYIDEAHSDGIYGPLGHGCVAALDKSQKVDIVLSTFGKAYGCHGAIASTSELFKQLFVNTAKPLIYSTALPPVQVALMKEASLIAEVEHDRATQLIELSAWLRSELKASGMNILNSESQIIPLVFKENSLTLKHFETLKKLGYWCPAIRTPTVPPQTARLRINITAAMNREILEPFLKDVIQNCNRE
jgi:8-amino-7-oxononanoate synthase